MLFERPPIYAASHILSGLIGYWYPAIFVLAILYHFTQYFLNFRLFFFQGSIEMGNSIEHTGLKISEVCLGLLISYLLAYNPEKAEKAEKAEAVELVVEEKKEVIE